MIILRTSTGTTEAKLQSFVLDLLPFSFVATCFLQKWENKSKHKKWMQACAQWGVKQLFSYWIIKAIISVLSCDHKDLSPEHLGAKCSNFLFVSQPIPCWTLAVFSQHNIINNALSESTMWATVQKLFLCQSKYTDLSFIYSKNGDPHSRCQPPTFYLPTAAALTGIHRDDK